MTVIGEETKQRLLGLGGAAYRLAARVLGRAEGAEDVVQQAYLAALTALPERLPPAELRAWFLGVVVNKARMYARGEARRARREAAVDSPAPAAPGEAAENKELIAHLRRALEDLDEKHRLPVALCCEEGLTQREAAAVLNMPERTISKYVGVGLERLREDLARSGYSCAPAVLAITLKSTAPAVPAGLTAALAQTMAASALAGTTAASTGATAFAVSAASGAVVWKAAACVLLVGALAGGGLIAHQEWAAAPVVRAESAPGDPPPPPVQPDRIVFTPRDADAQPVFDELAGRGLHVIWMGRARQLIVPAQLRYTPVEARRLVEDTAKQRGLKVAWLRQGAIALIHAGADEKEVERFLTGVKCGDAHIRAYAAWLAGWIEDPRVVPGLLTLAGDQDAAVGRQAVWSIQNLGWGAVLAVEPEAGLAIAARELKNPRLRTYTYAGDPKLEARMEQALAAGAIVPALGFAGEKALPLLEESLASSEAAVRDNATQGLARAGGEKAIALLRKPLLGNIPSANWRAAIALARMDGERSLPMLEEALSSKDQSLRQAAVQALGYCIQALRERGIAEAAQQKATAILEKALADAAPYIREQAIQALGRAGNDRALALLLELAEQPDPRGNPAELRVRWLAATALGLAGNEKVVALLAKLLKDEDVAVRMSAARALGQVGGDAAYALLEAALPDKESAVRYGAVEGLAKIGGAKALPALEAALEDKGADVRWFAASSLRYVGGDASLALLERALSDQNQQVGRAAARSLGAVGGDKSLAALDKALADPKWDLRYEVVASLDGFAGAQALPLLEKALGDADHRVRHRAVLGLDRVGGQKALDLIVAKADVEQNRDVLQAICQLLAVSPQHDPKVRAALEKADARLKALPASTPEPARPPSVKPPAPPEDF